MCNFLKEFWEWLPVSYDEYATSGVLQSSIGCEENFDHFNQLLIYAESIIRSDKVDAESINDLLSILALDNEMESILELIVERSSKKQLQSIIFHGIKHPLYHARWQLAEIIYRRKPKCYKEHLYALSQDSHPYVKKRSMNCLNYVD